MNAKEIQNLTQLLEDGELGIASGAMADDIIKFIESDPESTCRKYLEDAFACFEGAARFYRFKTVEAAIRHIVHEGDTEAIEWFLNNEGVDTWSIGTKDPCDYTAKELIELVPKEYRTEKKSTKKGAKRAPKRRSR